MSDHPERFGKNIKEWINDNWTQADLADLAGITPAALSQIINGKRIPRLDTACKIAEALGIPLDELLS